MRNEKINAFAKRWISEFQSGNIQEAERRMGDECKAVGFVMDAASLQQRFPEALAGYEGLARCIHEIDDGKQLGNTIYFQWRYYQHWACSPWDVQWFLAALDRLAELSS